MKEVRDDQDQADTIFTVLQLLTGAQPALFGGNMGKTAKGCQMARDQAEAAMRKR